jgi:hypothetical protein
MSAAWPSVAEERVLAMQHRFRDVKELAALQSPWQSNSTKIRLVFFVLTSFAISVFFGLMKLFSLPAGYVTCVVCIAGAEWLIRAKKMFGTGVESALWVGGLLGFIFGLPSEGKVEALLVFAAAFLIAGLRMRNAWFTTIAALLVIAYLGAKAGVLQHDWLPFGPPVAIAIAVIAASALTRTYERPSTEQILAALVVSMPLAAYGAAVAYATHFDWSTATTFLLLGGALLFAGFRRRDRAMILGGAGAVACGCIEVGLFVDAPYDMKLLSAGVSCAALGALIARALRGRTSGIVATKTTALQLDELLQLGATFVSTHDAPRGEQRPEVATGGGEFGGAGASGGY